MDTSIHHIALSACCEFCSGVRWLTTFILNDRYIYLTTCTTCDAPDEEDEPFGD